MRVGLGGEGEGWDTLTLLTLTLTPTTQPRKLKWVFSTSAFSSPDYLMMARVAVDSALNNTNLVS